MPPIYKRLPEHNAACTDLYYKHEKCEQENLFLRYFGVCSHIHVLLSKCLKEERAKFLVNSQKLSDAHKKKREQERERERAKEAEAT